MTYRITAYRNTPLAVFFGILLSGCSWFGNEETDESVPQLLDNETAPQTWYCYGNQDETWECLNSPDPSRVASIRPQPQAPFVMPSRDPEAPPPAPVSLEPTRPGVERMQPVAPDDNAILSQPADFYTVQLVALKDEQAVIDYARNNGMLAPLYAEITSEGSRWYVLLLGIYPDLATASTAKEEWERTKVLKVQPWVRRLGPLQQAMRLAIQDS
jgi:septal ring-binding cell division protein DamX